MADEDNQDEIPPQDDLSKEITVPPLPPPIISAKAAVDEKKSEDAADTLVAKDKHADSELARKLRERFSWVVSGLVLLWMAAIYVLLIAEGTHSFLCKPFELSEKIVLAALGTVTLNVIGLLVIILNSVFPLRKTDQNSN